MQGYSGTPRKRILLARRSPGPRPKHREIYWMRAADGANPKNNPALDFQPSWQPLP
jgi:hypothetical protein